MTRLTNVDLKSLAVAAVVIGMMVVIPLSMDTASAVNARHQEKKLASTFSMTGTTWTEVTGLSYYNLNLGNGADMAVTAFKYRATGGSTCDIEFRHIYDANGADYIMTELTDIDPDEYNIGSTTAANDHALSVFRDYELWVKNDCSAGTSYVYSGSSHNILEIEE